MLGKFFIADLMMTSNQISSVVIQFGTARCHALLELHSVQEWTFILFKEHGTYFLCYSACCSCYYPHRP